MQRFSEDTRRTADIAACRALLRSGSRTFHAASFLLPRRVREPASVLYAFCRLADDSVDIERGPAAVARLLARLASVYRGTPEAHPADRAMAEFVDRFAIPQHLPEALIEGLAWDEAGRRYQDLAALLGYAARVAGTVGVMMALLMGVRRPALLARAADLGMAMQLTNIARDVGEDARAGRVYLPLEWLREAGIDADAWLSSPRYTPALGGVIDRLLDVADGLYARADTGIAGLPASCRPGIRAARLLYAEIGQELRRKGLDSVTQRAVVPARRKLGLLAGVLAASGRDQQLEGAPCLEQASFLLAGLAETPTDAGTAAALRWWDLQARVIWVIDLFERIERRRASGATDAAERATA
jgi:phytoene synthase